MSALPEDVGAIDRSTYLGSSDVAAIMGVSKYRTPLDVYMAKVEPIDEPVDLDRARILRRGHVLEPYIVQMMVEQLRRDGHEVEVVGQGRRLRHPEHDFLAAEIDCELLVDGELCNGEAKSAGWRAAEEWGEAGTDEIPIHYGAQVHHAQIVTGRRTTWVGALFGLDDCVMYRVDADDELHAEILARMVGFWHDHVLARVPPDPVRIEDVHRLYRRSGPPPVEASPEILDHVQALRAIRAKIRALEDEAAEHQFAIAAYMAESDELVSGGQTILTFRHQVRRVVDAKRLKAERPDIFNAYLRESQSRPILFKRGK